MFARPTFFARRSRLQTVLLCLGAMLTTSFPALAATQNAPAAFSFDQYQTIDGFLPLLWNREQASMVIRIPSFDTEFLYQVSLASGIGSNPIGLDRGQPGRTFLAHFERQGKRVFLVERNTGYRALKAGGDERRAVEDSFPTSILWSFPVVAERDGQTFVEATSFFLRDAHGVVQQLRDTEQGAYSVDANRSAIYEPRTKGFPKNTEVEATITVATDGAPGQLVRSVSPTATAISMRQHHSFVQLPDDTFHPRAFDPRVGCEYIQFYDYGSPISEPLEKRWIVRHRLKKKDPTAAVSDPLEPIVYYVDPGMPEPVRSAIIEGVSWWNQAFEAAGYRNAFQVRVLPDGADPMDIRYNVINWVHRSTRGWAYGSTIVDPRTGEILKGTVTLDSQRARQDFLIGSGLAPQTGGASAANAACAADAVDFSYLADDAPSTNATEMALARIRQLGAHEVGHAIGLTHNFAASTYGRASVMDYPAPMIGINGDSLDFSQAYARGIGAYDTYAIRYAYSEFESPTSEQVGLDKIVQTGLADGMLFLTDQDARPASACEPRANLWDNGADVVAALRHEMDVRRIALGHFGIASVPERAPASELERRYLLLYLHHRYQLAATVKAVGGVRYAFALRAGSGASPDELPKPVEPETQRSALAAVLGTIDPAFLATPDRILSLLAPTAYGYDQGTAEHFSGRTGPTFDPLSATEISAALTLAALLEPARAARLNDQHRRDARMPSFADVLDATRTKVWAGPSKADVALASYAWRVQYVHVRVLMDLIDNPQADPQIRAEALGSLRVVAQWLKDNPGAGNEAVHRNAISAAIARFLARTGEPANTPHMAPTPPGDPIGG